MTFLYVLLGVALNTLVLGLWRPWLGAYGGEKGKNLARKEDLDAILTEVKAVTASQEQIKSKLAGDLWHHQSTWSQKRDIYAELVRAAYAVRDAYAGLQLFVGKTTAGRPDMEAEKLASARQLNQSVDDLGKAACLLEIFGNSACANTIQSYIHDGGPELDAAYYQGQMSRAIPLIKYIVDNARRDLDIVDEKQST